MSGKLLRSQVNEAADDDDGDDDGDDDVDAADPLGDGECAPLSQLLIDDVGEHREDDDDDDDVDDVRDAVDCVSFVCSIFV